MPVSPCGIDGRATLQRRGDAQCVVTEGEQPAASRGRVAEGLALPLRAPRADKPSSPSIHGMSGKHHAVDFLVGGGMRFVGIAQRVGGNVAGQVETQLRTQQPRRASGWLGAKMNWMSGRRRGSNSSFWPMVAWMRWWRARLSSVRSTCMMLSAKSLSRRAPKRRLAEHEAARRAQFLVERRRHARAPVAFGHEHHTAAPAAGADVARHGACVVFGRKRELEESLGRRPVGRQEIERQDRRAGSQEFRRGNALLRASADRR